MQSERNVMRDRSRDERLAGSAKASHLSAVGLQGGTRFPAARLSRQINSQRGNVAAKSSRDLAQREE